VATAGWGTFKSLTGTAPCTRGNEDEDTEMCYMLLCALSALCGPSSLSGLAARAKTQELRNWHFERVMV